MNKEGDNHQSDDHGIDFENIAASNGTPTSCSRFDVRSTMAVSKSGSQPDRQNKIHQDENRRNACLIRGCDDWRPSCFDGLLALSAALNFLPLSCRH